MVSQDHSIVTPTLIFIAGIGGSALLVVILFVKRQIMRFALRSHRDPHVQIGHGAPRSLQTQIDRQLTNASSRKYEPRLLGDDDYRLKFLNRDTIAGESCTYVYRMKAVDALSKLDDQLEKIECRRVRPPCGNLKEYILSLRDPPQAPLKGASVALCRAFAAAYDNAHYGLKPFGETEYNNFMTLLHELLSCIRHKGMKSKKSSQRSLPTAEASRIRTPGGSSIKSRPQTKSHTSQKGEPVLARVTSTEQSEASTSSQMDSMSPAQTAVTLLTRRNPSTKSSTGTSEETMEMLRRKRTSRGSELGSESEKGLRMKASNLSSGQSEETQPLMVSGRLVHQDSMAEEML
ncbi:uncharacterized protein C1orf43 homolog isoform X1 [Asterias rubens]|uniref:uncharacterized protein C1orf43 homolog isoform X1 n=1 Tax=Asterias rubens TaxID=7604 RepID=UPI00145566AB|nr:uncharacterized protein C1orf43 homolog isoform X1 [Asterias rubens]